MASPVWTAGLTWQEVRSLERVQKIAVDVIRGRQHTTYREGLAHRNLKSLERSQSEVCITIFQAPKIDKMVQNLSEQTDNKKLFYENTTQSSKNKNIKIEEISNPILNWSTEPVPPEERG